MSLEPKHCQVSTGFFLTKGLEMEINMQHSSNANLFSAQSWKI